MKTRKGLGYLVYFFCFLGLLCFEGCSSDSAQFHYGQFSAGEIVGLGFSTPSQKGYTDSKGTYSYYHGETICFHVGDIVLGCAKARPRLSVEDLVRETEIDKENIIIKIYQFLRSMDSYHNTYFSVHIDRKVDAAALDKTFDFVHSTTDDLKKLAEELLEPIYPGKREYLVPTEHAKKHLSNAILFAAYADTNDPQQYLPRCFATPVVIVSTASSDITVDLQKQAVDIYVINNPDASGANPCNCLSDDDTSIELSKDAFRVAGSMRIRGCSTAGAIKSQYSVEVEWPDPDPSPENPSHTPHFLGMQYGGKAWVFNDAGMVDPSRIRNPLSFYLQRELGKMTGSNSWAPRTKYFELFIVTGSSQKPTRTILTSGNLYRGVYILMENIHNSAHRIPIKDWDAKDPGVGPLILQINHPYTTGTPGQYYVANDGTKVPHYQDVLPPSPPAHANVGSPLTMKSPNSKAFFDMSNNAEPINQEQLKEIKQWFYTTGSLPYSAAPPHGWAGHFDSPPFRA